MRMLLDGPVIVDEAPEFEYRGGMFYATIKVGEDEICLCFRPSTFFQGIADAACETRKARLIGAKVVQFPGAG